MLPPRGGGGISLQSLICFFVSCYCMQDDNPGASARSSLERMIMVKSSSIPTQKDIETSCLGNDEVFAAHAGCAFIMLRGMCATAKKIVPSVSS